VEGKENQVSEECVFVCEGARVFVCVCVMAARNFGACA